MHIKPSDGLRLGASFYHDVISKGSTVHNHTTGSTTTALGKINQAITTLSVSYNDSVFSKKFELLAESSMAINKSDSLGAQKAIASYAYAGLRVTEKIIPYIRIDDIRYNNNEVYYMSNNTRSFIGGVRYELSYLAVFKLEYQHIKSHMASNLDNIVFQVAVGF
jgi:hypothetical protein